MSNPTLGNSAQFTNPFNILPDIIYTNPTSGIIQFGRPIHLDSHMPISLPNPTLATTQFTDPIHLDNNVPISFPNPTLGVNQFIKPFDILPNPSLTKFNPTIGNNYQFTTPVLSGGQFNTYDILDIPPTGTVFVNPTLNTDPALPDQFSRRDTEQNIAAANWYARSAQNTNAPDGGAVNTALSLAAGISGVPFLSSVTNTLLGGATNTPYATLPLDKLKRLPGIQYADFRSRINSAVQVIKDPRKLLTARADGTFGTFRRKIGNGKMIAYAAAAASPAGAYSIFNLNASGKFGYGWGDHDNPNAIRNDFTIGSEVTTRWAGGKAEKIKNDKVKRDAKKPKWKIEPTSKIIPFRGDKVNVIDFNQRTLKEAYKWKPTSFLKTEGAVGRFIASDSLTQDFIKFFFTGPSLQNGAPEDTTDDIMVFRASITNLSDNFNSNWNPVQFIGRADPNYHYTGYSRDLSVGFDIYATSRDELKPIWRKLNALAGYTTPEYNFEDIALRGPWMRITIGDLFVQQPVVLNSLSFDYDTEASWEINIEDDPTNMQVPFKISVTTQFNMITDFLPQKGGRFFSLAGKNYNSQGMPERGSDNWLSDFKDNVDPVEIEKVKTDKKKKEKRIPLTDSKTITNEQPD
tara:strand:+ start:5579 stop:7471 length:1893 start_codon:yes stop_codon:yes gene_type:complete